MKYVYMFNECKKKDIYDKLGKVGTYLSEITNLGLPVPNGFIITTDACNQYYENKQNINREILEQINEYLINLEQSTQKKFGSIDNPLLIAVKCSSKNVPNIMNTILNVGLTKEIVENLSKNTDEFVWIWENYFNLINDYARNVMGIDLEYYQNIQNTLNNNQSLLTIEKLRTLSESLKKEYKSKTLTEFPNNPLEQLYLIINNAFKAWNNPLANIYRKDMSTPFSDGMAICIQSMVFGNMNENCKTGTIFTRSPITGEKFFIDKKNNQSLETSFDVYDDSTIEFKILSNKFPEIYNQLKNISSSLEHHYKDMLKIDYVIENNTLFITQICIGKRTAKAALKIACDFCDHSKELPIMPQPDHISLKDCYKDMYIIENSKPLITQTFIGERTIKSALNIAYDFCDYSKELSITPQSNRVLRKIK